MPWTLWGMMARKAASPNRTRHRSSAFEFLASSTRAAWGLRQERLADGHLQHGLVAQRDRHRALDRDLVRILPGRIDLRLVIRRARWGRGLGVGDARQRQEG